MLVKEWCLPDNAVRCLEGGFVESGQGGGGGPTPTPALVASIFNDTFAQVRDPSGVLADGLEHQVVITTAVSPVSGLNVGTDIWFTDADDNMGATFKAYPASASGADAKWKPSDLVAWITAGNVLTVRLDTVTEPSEPRLCVLAVGAP